MKTFFRDEKGNVVLMQMPNIPLLIAIFAAAVRFFASGPIYHFMDLVFFGSIFTWAYLEVTSGVNYFRRLLGVIVFIIILWPHF